MNTKITFEQIQSSPIVPFFNSPAAPAPAPLRGARAFFGVGNDHGQQTKGNVTGGSWLQGFTVQTKDGPRAVTGWSYMEDQARVRAVSDFSVPISGVGRTGGGGEGYGGIFAVRNDSAVPFNAWALYVDAIKAHANAGNTVAIEFDAANLPGPSPMGGKTPYRSNVQGMVNNVTIAAGSDESVFGRSYAIDSMIDMGNNGGAAWTGINFQYNAIMREGVPDDTSSPGNAGYARAISLAHDQGLSWYPQDHDGTEARNRPEVFRMFSTINSATHRSAFLFDDTGMVYRHRVGTAFNLFRVAYDAAANQGIVVQPGNSATLPGIKVEGTPTNINLLLSPKNDGCVVIANVRNFASNAEAAAGGVPLGGLYRNGGTLMIRTA